jgi:hypothetical protein
MALRASIQQQVQAQHVLLSADAVVMSVRHAIDSRAGGLDELRVMDALQVAAPDQRYLET